MQLKYVGPHPEVVVDELDQEKVIAAGEPVEVPDDLAARLLEQNTWAKVEAKVEAKAKPAQPQTAPESADIATATTTKKGDS